MRRMPDIYWLAGLLEGEGCFYARESNPRPRIILGMTDLDTVSRAKSILGKSGLSPVPRAGNKTMYYLTVCGKPAIGWMMTLYSLMGSRRRSKIRDIISRWRVRRWGRNQHVTA